jgi:hypothetical protein
MVPHPDRIVARHGDRIGGEAQAGPPPIAFRVGQSG